MDQSNAADFVRFVIFVLYGLTIGHVAWIIRKYAKYTKRLLPRHITLVGVMFLVALTEVAWQNITRLGMPFTLYLPINLFIMAGSLISMRQMRTHLVRKYREH